MNLKHWIIPTVQNGYRARLIKVPALAVVMIGLFLLNTGLGTIPVRTISADVTVTDLLNAHNVERTKNGLEPLEYSSVLSNSAQRKAQAMLDSDCWSHYCPAGKSPWDFFIDADYDYLYAGENLAEGFEDIEDVMVAWMNSETHRANILRGEYKEIGFGMVIGTFQGVENSTVIAVHFGTLQPSAKQVVTANTAGQIPSPEILEPQNGESFNTSGITIRGSADEANQVELFESGQPWALADANEGIFIFRSQAELDEGNYVISAQSVNGSARSSLSDPVTFKIDRQPNPVNSEQLVLLATDYDDVVALQINAGDMKEVTIQLGEQSTSLQQLSASLWQADLSSTDLIASEVLGISTVDSAGNTWEGDIPTSSLQNKLMDTEQHVDASDSQTAVLRSQINWAVLLVLIAMFLADFVVLNRTGQTRKHTKESLHIALLMVVAIVVLTGTFVGQIDQGLSL